MMESHRPSLAPHRVGTASGARHTGAVIAEALLLGDDLIVWILLALGGAMFAGNVAALLRPPELKRVEDDLDRAPRGRSIVMAIVGFLAAVAALAALLN